MRAVRPFLVCALLTSPILASVAAHADDHSYAEGNIVNVSFIRTVDGKFEAYLNWLDKFWKPAQEVAKKAGYIVNYQVLLAEPRTPDDADVYLVVTTKNWAAVDGWIAKGDAIATQIEGSVAAAEKSEFERGAIRRVLGSQTMQVLDLK